MEPTTPQPRNNMMLWIIVAIILIGGIAVFATRSSTPASLTAESSPSPSATPEITGMPMDAHGDEPVTPSADGAQTSSSPTPSSDGAQVHTVTVVGQNFSFTPSQIHVKKGEKVKIVFQNSGGTHDWAIDEFNVHTTRIQGGQSTSVEFTPTKTGTFEYYCSVGSHRAMGMKGNLIVE